MKMKSTTTSICVFLLILVLLEMNCCQGCLKHEREALLSLNAQFDHPLTWKNNTDCCEWERVDCNTTTRRVVELNLFNVMDYNHLGNWYVNFSDFLVFEDLKRLGLSTNSIAGCVEYEGLRLSNLEFISLSNNLLNNTESIQSCLDGLSSLKSLHLSNNGINETLPQGLLLLSNLEILNLGYNDINNFVVPEGSTSLTKLKVLYLDGNRMDGNMLLQMSLQPFSSITQLYLGENQINGTINAAGLLSLSNLEILDLSYNNIRNFVVHEGSTSLTKLKVLYLDGNSKDGNMLLQMSLQPFSSITQLYLTENQINGTINAGLLSLRNLEILDLSYNNIRNFVVHEGSTSLTKLKVLYLDGNRMDGNMLLQMSLQPFSSITELYLRENQINGTINAAGLLSLSNLEILDLRYNNIRNFVVHEGSTSLTKLKVLYLDGNRMDGNMLQKSLQPFSSIRELYLTGNQFNGIVLAADFRDLGNLDALYLYSSSNLVNEFFKSIGLLTSLKFLSLSNCSITGTLPLAEWYKLKNLEKLDLTDNKFEGRLPSSFCNMSSLRTLQLSGSNNFIGSFSSNIASFTSLEYLHFEGNHFEFPISFMPFSNHSNIKGIYGNGNKVILDSHPTLQTWVPKFQLEALHLSSSAMTNSLPLPNFLLYQNNLDELDLSSTVKLEGGFPKWLLKNNTGMRYLSLRNCSLTGTFQLPSHPHRVIESLDISNNHFVGKLPRHWSQNLPFLTGIFMSNNNFEGSIPSDFAEHGSLEYLDLSQNKLSGSVPSFLTSSNIMFIQLRNNELSGLPKRMFNGNSLLRMLDLSYNHIRSGIQDMIQEFNHTGLNILMLKGNHFTGEIPKELCQLRDITILDLSHNHFYGPIPSCIGKMPFQNNNPDELKKLFDGDMMAQYSVLHSNLISSDGDMMAEYSRLDPYLPFVKEEATFTTKQSSLTYKGSILTYMTGIDLSYNKLSGNIPSELGNLTKIRAMNLSYNDLRGKIPTTFSNLVHTESLDLSFNNLCGSIPPQLNQLSFLEVFSVAHNNLSGSLPERKGQFLTFDESSYEGNPFLCGPPLPKSCNAFILPNGSNTEGDNDHFVDMYFFWVSFVVSYTSVLLVIAIILYINPYWRRAWFYYIELVSTNCYYFIEDNLCKLPINI